MDLPKEYRFTVLIKYFILKKVSETEFSNEGILASPSILNTFLKSALMFAGKYETDFLLACRVFNGFTTQKISYLLLLPEIEVKEFYQA